MPDSPLKLSLPAARRIALAAQGFGRANPAIRHRGDVARWGRRLGVVQIDPIAIVERAQYLPLFSRTGAYDKQLLDAAAWPVKAKRTRSLTEYWAHEAALIPVEDWPLFAWRMEALRHGRWVHSRGAAEEHPEVANDILDGIREQGPMTARALSAQFAPGMRYARQGWASATVAKRICEQYLAAGVLAVDHRESNMRAYDLAERVVPEAAAAQPPSREEAHTALVRKASRALGVATAADLADYYRLAPGETRTAATTLVEHGELIPVTVDGWKDLAYLDPEARRPRRIEGAALLSPFDSLIFSRPRVLRLFDFDYRIEIYVPADQRRYGYYVYPLLLDGELVARVDLKRGGVDQRLLEVVSAHLEHGRTAAPVARALAEQLEALAAWLALDGVQPTGSGDLMPALAAVLG